MRIDEKEFSRLPNHLRAMFRKLPNPGSEEVLAAFPDTGGEKEARTATRGGSAWHGRESFGSPEKAGTWPADIGGSAARFFYSAKADAWDRLGSKHPTVKPVDLMAYLCRLVTPPGGTVLDPFAGSGTTGMACMREGFNAVLIEREAEYVADIKRRIAHVSGQDAPLFGGSAA
jgi:site-specific DNA-methyltransferase (adenine-specific)